MIVLMAGLPGTGKSTLARELARRTGGCVVGKDEIRAAIFAPEDIQFSTAQDDFVMEIMLDAADWLLKKNAGRARFSKMAGHSHSATRSIASCALLASTISRGASSNAFARTSRPGDVLISNRNRAIRQPIVPTRYIAR